MAGIPGFLLDGMGKDVTIEPYLGISGDGAPAYDPPVTLRALVEDARRYVRSQNGEQVISETTVYLPLGTACPPRSRIALPTRSSTVITVSAFDGGTFPVPSHLEVACE